ncbi:MAG: RNA recognition motif domain-containing protein [Candidatus Rifleibacteriota bacterium]
MAFKIFVGNLPFAVDNSRLEQEFARFGQVESAKVIMDRNSGRSRGYGFVEFAEKESADEAIAKMNEQEMDGRKLTVSLAKTQS